MAQKTHLMKKIIALRCAVFMFSFSLVIIHASDTFADAGNEVQAGAFGVEENAQEFRNRLEQEGKHAFLRKKEVNGKTLYAVIVRESGEAPAPDEVQVGVFGVEENAQALRNRLEQEGKYAFLRKKEVNGKTLYAVIVSESDTPAPAEMPAPEPSAEEPMGGPEEVEEADADMMEAEAMVEEVVDEPEFQEMTPDVTSGAQMPDEMAAPMTEDPAEEPMRMDSPAISHPVDMTAPAASAAIEEEPPAVPASDDEKQLIPIKGIGVVFDIHIKGRARIYEEPSFKSRRVGYRSDVGDVKIVSETRSGWIVVRGFVSDNFMYVPGDDVIYYSLDKKGRRKKRLNERPEVR